MKNVIERISTNQVKASDGLNSKHLGGNTQHTHWGFLSAFMRTKTSALKIICWNYIQKGNQEMRMCLDCTAYFQLWRNKCKRFCTLAKGEESERKRILCVLAFFDKSWEPSARGSFLKSALWRSIYRNWFSNWKKRLILGWVVPKALEIESAVTLAHLSMTGDNARNEISRSL